MKVRSRKFKRMTKVRAYRKARQMVKKRRKEKALGTVSIQQQKDERYNHRRKTVLDFLSLFSKIWLLRKKLMFSTLMMIASQLGYRFGTNTAEERFQVARNEIHRLRK